MPHRGVILGTRGSWLGLGTRYSWLGLGTRYSWLGLGTRYSWLGLGTRGSNLSFRRPLDCYLICCACGLSRISPANIINVPSPSPTRAIRTRVAAQASAPVSGSATGARMPIGFTPRL